MSKTQMKIVDIHTKVCGMSLVGIIGDPPVDFGNYCSVKEGYLVNLWAENLEALVEREIIGDKMKAIKLDGGDKFWVVDDRIPKEYLHVKPCFTGIGGSSLAYKQAIGLSLAIQGLTLSEDHCVCETHLEIVASLGRTSWQYTDTEQITTGHCVICDKEFEMRKPYTPPESRKLNVKWTRETEMFFNVGE